jgi:hypothetical protein
MCKKILISVGAIPAKLDSVKFITNRFKGGLALKTANFLAEKGNDVTIIAWKFTEIKTNLPIIYIEDVMDYYKKVLAFKADAYILAGAVANLMPSSPYEGKFPSHKYKVGEKFNVEFEIAPRVIDEIKKVYPRSTLIAYKLYDGSHDELISSAKKTLFDSSANVVFANHPSWAKTKKIVLTQDGAVFECSFDEHCNLIHKLINEDFYSTEVNGDNQNQLNEIEEYVVNNYPIFEENGRFYGTFAVKRTNSFITSTRGKKSGKTDISEVFSVNNDTKKITASSKATLNAPLLAKMFDLNNNFTILLHGHKLIGKVIHSEYEFAGSVGDLNFASHVNAGEEILLTNHGYIVGFETVSQFKEYLKDTNV